MLGNKEMIKKLLSLGVGYVENIYAVSMIEAARKGYEDIFEWMIYLGKDKIKKEDYKQALESTTNKKIQHMIKKYFLV